MHRASNPLWRLYEPVAMVLGLGLLAMICLGWTLVALVLTLLLPRRTTRRVGRLGIRYGFRLYVFLLQTLCGCRFELQDLEWLARERGSQPLVLVANHPSLLDAVILTAFLPNAVCIMKADVLHNLLMGFGARMAGYITNDAPLAMIRHAIAELEQGACLILFPEATRTPEAPVGRCSNTAGVIAARAGVPVQTLLIEMSSPYLGKQWPLWRPPRLPLRCRIRAGERLQQVAEPHAFGKQIEHYFRRSLAADANRMPVDGALHDGGVTER